MALCVGATDSASALHHVLLERDGKQIQVDGRLVVTAEDGGLLLLAADGVLWSVLPDELLQQKSDAVPFRAMTADQVAQDVLAELPEGFDVHKTAHYVICYNTSRAYAQWCGALFERLYRAFTNYWSRKGFDLVEPQFPLVAVVFADRKSYAKFSDPELGDLAESVVGYYSLRTNRMTMYDLTGLESLSRFRNRRGTAAQINRILARPEAIRTVSTIVHEATHQIAFNCGLHERYSDCPLWFSEGIAVFFEAPDLSSAKGWRGIGTVNGPRLARFQEYLRRRPANSLRTLIRDDRRFRDPDQSLDAYAEAWALTYYLIQKRSKEYIAYLRMLSQKKPFFHNSPATRLKEFQQAFGDLEQLEADFLRSVADIR
jgi:hypothetical protein